jgi:hypothetical protein
MCWEEELTNPEPLQVRHVSGLVPGGTPAPPGKKKKPGCQENIFHKITIAYKIKSPKKCIYILQVSHGTVV